MSINDEVSRKQALLEGLELLFDVKDVQITSKDSSVDCSLHVGASKVTLILDESMKLKDIKVVGSSASIDINALLNEAQSLPTPQDLRFVISYINSANACQRTLQAHIKRVMKDCIVRQIGTNKLELILSNGVIATLVVHDCYPDVPCGVQLTELVGVTISTAQREAVFSAVNSACISNIGQMHTELKRGLLVQ